jgi:hypothetical protein
MIVYICSHCEVAERTFNGHRERELEPPALDVLVEGLAPFLRDPCSLTREARSLWSLGTARFFMGSPRSTVIIAFIPLKDYNYLIAMFVMTP